MTNDKITNKKTLFQIIYEHLKTKPATDEEISQLKKDLERETLKAKIREEKLKHKGGSGVEKFARLSQELFGKNENVKEPRL